MAASGVISGATRGPGGSALARHLADKRGVPENDMTQLGECRGIVSTTIEDAIMELTRIVSHAVSRQSIYHVHVDPEQPWTEQQWGRFWILFETEFAFERQPFVEAVHEKHGREHRHRAYSRVCPAGTVIPLDHDYARREKIGRLVEFEFAGRHVPGAHNRAVVAALRRAGITDCADSIEAAGLTTIPKPVARMTPKQRHQSVNTRIDPVDVANVAFRVWRQSPTERLVEHFALEGLCLCQGDRVPVLVDLAGGVHSLTRVIGWASAAAGQRIRAADVVARITDLSLLLISNQGADYHDRNDPIEYSSDLDAQDHASPAEIRGFGGEAADSRKGGEKHRSARFEPNGCGNAGNVREFGDYQGSDAKSSDTETGRTEQFGQNTRFSRGPGSVQQRNSRRSGPTGRAVGRSRIADFRTERLLSEGPLARKIEGLSMLIDILDPGVRMRRQSEELRVEAMLNQTGFASKLARVERLIRPLLDTILRMAKPIFGSTVVNDPPCLAGGQSGPDHQAEFSHDFGP